MLHAHNRRFPLVLRRLVVRAEWNIRPASNIYRYPLDAVTKSTKEYASIEEVAMTRYGDYILAISMTLNGSMAVVYAMQGHWRQAGYWFAALQLNYWLMGMK